MLDYRLHYAILQQEDRLRQAERRSRHGIRIARPPRHRRPRERR